ncbi:putative recombination initiation defects 3 [Sesamum angolense]|uniref:Recombination initiation defects 3 n=1 Tax=Sesamum angolense TaxID=2727404 RepID=A0AAE1XGG0_9LAMI|nr:putative recombination initiation defects 3 [Sesamum angolense]
MGSNPVRMKMKINKACDLSSISVLPPQTRRRPSMVSSGLESSLIFPRSQVASQLRPQQPQQSQLTLSQGVSSQHGLFSQFSQNSQDEILTNEDLKKEKIRLGGQVSEELERRIGMIETSLSRFSMILDSIQSDIVQVNKATKEVALESEYTTCLHCKKPKIQLAIRFKLIKTIIDQSKGQQDIKTCLDTGLNSLSGEIISVLSALSEKIDTKMAISRSTTIPKQKQATPPMHGPKAVSYHAPPQEVQFRTECIEHPSFYLSRFDPQQMLLSAILLNYFFSVLCTSKSVLCMKIVCTKAFDSTTNKSTTEGYIGRLDISKTRRSRRQEKDEYSIKEAKEETARILRKARRRKRKYCDTIIIN